MAEKAVPVAKWVLAGFGAVFLCGMVGMAVLALIEEGSTGPSELAQNPQQQDSILAERKAREYQEQLGLSNEQTLQVAQFLREAREQRKADNQAAPGDFRARIGARMQHLHELEERIQAILTPEQQTRFDAMKESRRAQLQGARGAFQQINPEAAQTLRDKAKEMGLVPGSTGNGE